MIDEGLEPRGIPQLFPDEIFSSCYPASSCMTLCREMRDGDLEPVLLYAVSSNTVIPKIAQHMCVSIDRNVSVLPYAANVTLLS